MKTPIWDNCKTLTSIHKHERGQPSKPFRLVSPGMTATACLAGKRIDIKITATQENDLSFIGIVSWIDTGDRTKIDLQVGDTVVIPLDKICHLNQDIK